MTSRFFGRKSRFFSICISKNSPSSCNHFDGRQHFCGDQFSLCFSTFLRYRLTFGNDLSIKIIAKKKDFVIQKSEKRRFSTKKKSRSPAKFFKLQIKNFTLVRTYVRVAYCHDLNAWRPHPAMQTLKTKMKFDLLRIFIL